MRKNTGFYSVIGVIALLAMIAILPGAAGASNESTEINAHVTSYYPGLGIYVTAPVNTTAPMLSQFVVSMRSPGNSTYSIYYAGTLYAQGTFAWRGSQNVSGGSGSTVLLTVEITSSVLKVTMTYTYTLMLMTPQEYVNYVQTHQPTPGTVTYAALGGFSAFALILAVIFFRMHLPVQRSFIRKGHIKRGLDRIA